MSADRSAESCRLLPYWPMLTSEEQMSVLSHSLIRRFCAGELIHSGNDDCLGQVMVLSGELRTYLTSEEGKEVTLFMLREGDPCVLSSSCILGQITFETQIMAVKDTSLLIVPMGIFRQITDRNTDVKLYIYELALERFSQVMWSMQQVLFFGFDRRLATFLIGEYRRTGDPVIRMTHEQIARDVSSAREVVARMLKRFGAEGLVVSERGSVRLTDIPGLEKLL